MAQYQYAKPFDFVRDFQKVKKDVSDLQIRIPSTISNVVQVPPSGDSSGASDFINISNALASGCCSLLPGTYFVNAPIIIPDQSALFGVNPSWGIPTGNYGAGGLPLQGTIIRAGSGFSGAAILAFGGVGTVQHGGQRLYNLTVSGTGAPSGTHGIQSTGYVGGVKMRDVVVWGMAGSSANGLNTLNDGTPGHQPDFWQVDGCKFSNCGGWGVLLTAMSDSWFVNTESTGNATGNWSITGGPDSRYIACRGSSSTAGIGWQFVGNAGYTGRWTMVGCEAKLNSGVGISLSGAGTGLLIMDAVTSTGNSGANWSYSGSMSVESSAAWNSSTSAPTIS